MAGVSGRATLRGTAEAGEASTAEAAIRSKATTWTTAAWPGQQAEAK